MEREDYTNRQGECPRCHSTDLNYLSQETADDEIYYYYRCEECGQEGEERYSLVFQGHKIYTDDDEIEL